MKINGTTNSIGPNSAAPINTSNQNPPPFTRSAATQNKPAQSQKPSTTNATSAKPAPAAAKDKTLTFIDNWDVAPAHFKNETDIYLHSHLTPNAEVIRDIFHEAINFGHFKLDPPQIPQAPHVEQVPPVPHHAMMMMQHGFRINGPTTVVREGSHQVEDHINGGFQMHFGTQRNGINYHLNLQQNAVGTPYAESISWGTPGTGAHGMMRRTMPVQSDHR